MIFQDDKLELILLLVQGHFREITEEETRQVKTYVVENPFIQGSLLDEFQTLLFNLLLRGSSNGLAFLPTSLRKWTSLGFL